VAVSNFGATATYRLTASPTKTQATTAIQVCQTDPTTGVCIDAPTSSGVTLSLASEQNATFAVFVSASSALEEDVLTNRIVVRLEDETGKVFGATSVALMGSAG